MTRKDYEAIAEVIHEGPGEWEYPAGVGESFGRADCFREGYRAATKNIAFDLCKVLKEDNPRFDSERFLRACGL